MDQDRRPDAPVGSSEQAPAGSRDANAGCCERTAAALLRPQLGQIRLASVSRAEPFFHYSNGPAFDPASYHQALPRSAFRPKATDPADLDDAAGRPLLAGISGVAGQGG